MQAITTEGNAPKNAPLDMTKWTEIVNAWDVTTETQQVYCNRLGININTFSYVRCKLLKKTHPKNSFIPMTVIKSHSIPLSQDSTITLENKEGLKVFIPVNLPADQLVKIIKMCGW